MLPFLFACLFFDLCLATWTSVFPVPSNAAAGVAEAFGTVVIVVAAGSNHILDTVTGTWATLPTKMPTADRHQFAGGLSHSNDYFAMSGKSSPTVLYASTERYSPLSGTWTTRASIPTSRFNCGGGSDGQLIWVVGAQSTLDFVERYSIPSDTWTTIAPTLPIAVARPGVAYEGGFLFVSRAMSLHCFDTTAETWTTKAELPHSVGSLYDMFDCVRTTCFMSTDSGPAPATSSDIWRYELTSDGWTTFGYLPIASYGGSMAITPYGYLVVVGSFPGYKDVFAYSTGIDASIQGDPLITRLDGSLHHAHLRPGVFNLLTTPSAVVNVALVDMASLPPGDNLVIALVTVIARVGDQPFLVECSSASEDCFVSSPLSWSGQSHTLLIPLDGCDVMVSLVRQAVVELPPVGGGGSRHFAPTNYYNVRVSMSPSYSAAVGGLLADFSSSGDIDHHHIESGCLFETSSSPSLSLFSADVSSLGLRC